MVPNIPLIVYAGIATATGCVWWVDYRARTPSHLPHPPFLFKDLGTLIEQLAILKEQSDFILKYTTLTPQIKKKPQGYVSHISLTTTAFDAKAVTKHQFPLITI